MNKHRKPRVLVAKAGLDGHDRGAKVVARALKDAGIEVIYTGLHQTPDQIVRIAIQEDVDAIGLSLLSGAHLTICKKIFEDLTERGLTDIALVVGGTIPESDINQLKEIGVAEVFPTESDIDEIVSFFTHICQR